MKQQTIHYQTYLLRALQEGMQAVFAAHPDHFLRNVRAEVDWVEDKATYPLVLVRYYEREVLNAGVGHEEWIDVPLGDDPDVTRRVRLEHSIYRGDVEFAIYAESTYDRALLADSLVQTLRFGDTELYTQAFLDHVYADEDDVPEAKLHFINVDSDRITGMGQSQVRPPWDPEDRMIYTISYRSAVMGELYSRIPDPTEAPGLVTKVDILPYISELGYPVPEGEPHNGHPWVGDDELTP